MLHDPKGGRPPLDPIKCSKCAQVTTQPRFIIFRHVVSVLVLTRTTPNGGIYCGDCAPRVAFRASAISAVFGWWGIPWGPINTIKEIVRNALGGQANAAADEELLWHNAVAFLDQNKLDLSISLAQHLRAAKNTEIANRAGELFDHLSASGVVPAKLHSEWSIKPAAVIGQIALGCAIPALALLLVTLGGSAGIHYPGGAKAAPSVIQPN